MKILFWAILFVFSGLSYAQPLAPSVRAIEKGSAGDSRKKYEIELRNFGKEGEVKLQVFFLGKTNKEMPVALDYSFETVKFTASEISKTIHLESKEQKDFKQSHSYSALQGNRKGPEIKGIAVAVLEGPNLEDIPATKVTSFYSTIAGLSSKDAARMVADPKNRPAAD